MKFSNKIFFCLVLLTPIFSQSYAFDLAHRFGLGVGAGFPVPVWGNQFNDVADPKWEASAFGKYFFTSTVGMEAGASMSKYKDTDLKFKNIDVMGLWRMAGAASMSPVIGLGAAVTDIQNYSPASAKLSILGRIGAEFDIHTNMNVGVLADYQYVSKIMGDMPTNPAHVIIPKVTLTWFFGGAESGDGVHEKTKDDKEKSSAANDKVSDVVATSSSSTSKTPDLTVMFDSEKADISNEYIVRLKKIAAKMKKNSDIAGIIEGHADSRGSSQFNMDLSKRRAEAVKKQLIKYGVEEARLETEGLGENNPIANNKTKEGRAKNRRSALYISLKEKSHLM
jgi:outer membrane protein OmpA-like peptidoglycan-associated protein